MSSPIYTVSALVHYIKSSLDNDMNIQAVFIKGEISNFTNHRSGHWYFTLKDAKARMSCVMFQTHAARCPILLKEGMKVIVTASVSMYEAAGSTQLYISKVQVDGLGDLFLQLEQSKERLLKEGLFDESHKKQLPEYPLSIGIITAKTGAAVQDMLTTIVRRWPIAHVVVYPCLVQGATASKQLAEVLVKADQEDHDVLLLGRGGGSLEDLWCFNDEHLARVIYELNTVLVSGVGHETDTTLVDYVSDARAPTPTAAAELITPDIYEVMQAIQGYQKRMLQALRAIDRNARHHFQRVANHRYLQNPLQFVEHANLQLAMHVKAFGHVEDDIEKNRYHLQMQAHMLANQATLCITHTDVAIKQMRTILIEHMQRHLHDDTERFHHQTELLDAFSPLKILTRGYSIISKDKIIRSVQELQPQDEVAIRLHDGIVSATIIDTKESKHE